MLDKNTINLKSEFQKLLENQHTIYCLKSGDFVFDDFIIKFLLKEFSAQKLNLEDPISDFSSVNNGHFIVHFYHENQIKNQLGKLLNLLQENHKSSPKIIFLIPERLYPYLITHNIYSNFLFLSAKIKDYGISVFLKTLPLKFKSDINDNSKESLLGFFQKHRSISDLKFFVELKKLYGEEIEIQQIFQEDWIQNYHSKLNQQGKKLLLNISERYSTREAEAFFRSFIFFSQNEPIDQYLNLQEISSYSGLSSDLVLDLLQLVTSQEYQLIVEENGRFFIKIKAYLLAWQDLKLWLSKEEDAVKHFYQLQSLATSFFNRSGTLLSNDQIEQALQWKKECESIIDWNQKYDLDINTINGYVLLSQTSQEEALKAAQAKRKRLLKNSIRLSIIVSIAFVLSTFTALVAYLERNSAIKQQELAIKAKEEAIEAKEIAEQERLQAIEARQKEFSALEKAEKERLIALQARGQAEKERLNALFSLDLAKKSELEASLAKEVAEKNEQLANQAKEVAQINFEKSENLRKQQEARSEALQALGFYANGDTQSGRSLANNAYFKNVNNGGQWFQPDIVFALLNGKLQSGEILHQIDLEHPVKSIAFSPKQDLLAVHTINGEIKVYQNNPIEELYSKNIGFIQSIHFIGDQKLVYLDLKGKFFSLDLSSTPKSNSLVDLNKTYTKIFNLSTSGDSLGVTSTEGIEILISKGEKLIKINEYSGNNISAIFNEKDHWLWGENNRLYKVNKVSKEKELLFTGNFPISKITKSTIKGCWIVGDEGGTIYLISENKKFSPEQFSVHSSKVSQLVILPHDLDTDILLSAGFDGKLFMYFLHRTTPNSTSISSRISLGGHKSWITDFTIDPKNKIAYSAGNDRSVRLWPLTISQMLK